MCDSCWPNLGSFTITASANLHVTNLTYNGRPVVFEQNSPREAQ